MPPAQLRIIHPRPVVNPVQSQFALFLLAVVLVLVVGRSVFLNASQIEPPRVVMILLYNERRRELYGNVVKPDGFYAFTGYYYLHIAFLCGNVLELAPEQYLFK